MHTRKSVLSLPTGDPILVWYEKAVAAMKLRPITNPTSWRYQGAIHDYDPATDPFPVAPMPPAAEQAKYWRKCQHGSWYFLPWHRAYLLYFEKIVRKTIVGLGGPATWALPYWDYSANNNARRLPLAFQSPTLPGGGVNHLFVAQRAPGANSNTPVGSAASSSTASAMGKPQFINTPPPVAQFGGGSTGFSHNGAFVGQLESTPHGSMHVAVGGPTGWMSAFDTAALDPIFWLHHANIDRLWTLWLNSAPSRVNPTQATWLTGLVFNFHDENGVPVVIRTNQVLVTTAPLLDYVYQAVPGVAGGGIIAAAGVTGDTPVPQNPAEMLGATSEPVTLGINPVHAQFPLIAPTGPAPAGGGLVARAGGAEANRKVFLCLENITAASRPIESYEVYVNVPAGANPSSHPELLAGLMPMFGVVESSRGDDEHGGSGLNYSLEITGIVADLVAAGTWAPATIRVTIIPHRNEGDREANVLTKPVQVGRISLYYE